MFYFHLAATNLRAHKRIFVPFLLAMTLLTVMNVVMLSAYMDSGALFANNGDGIQAAAQEMFKYGSEVMMIFAVILGTYANSFLLKQRTKQLALYSVIGFGKRELRHMVSAELIICAGISIVCGAVFGAAFSRLSYLALGKMLGMPGHAHFGLDLKPILVSAAVIALIFVLLILIDANWLRKHRPLAMLQAASAGEREPKTRWLMLIIGIITLGAGYAAAIGITDPLGALQWFFIAVILVIVGTYALFIAGSVFIYKLLRKNKHYYYQPAHFINVANMIHRMRQNGAGLASITILATMTLVTIATTITLYLGVPQIVSSSTPADMQYIRATSADKLATGKVTPAQNQAAVAAIAKKHHVTITKRSVATISTGLPIKLGAKRVLAASNKDYAGTFGPAKGLMTADIMTLANYNQMTGQNIQLARSSMLLGTNTNQHRRQLAFGPHVLRVQGTARMPYASKLGGTKNALFVFKDNAVITQVAHALSAKLSKKTLAATLANAQTTVYLELKGSDANQIAMAKEVQHAKIGTLNVQSAAQSRSSVLQWMSAFLFMGILLGIMFILATALILYYKQVSEGLADAKRYKILQQVGLSEREVKATINSQLLTLFYVPLVVAAVHTAVAAPFIQRVLVLFGITNWTQFLTIIGITLLVFAAIYVVMYKATARVYYRIVR
ncbi:FtsX-like permease family protein [Lacticaseibacillus zhaodongensis]|uniref:FtsX-like permease family protein n=1 Tax=Lacticaseibacillus zhaodongensis TaxID=2668065 RepID=UPI0012D36430|nr:ABC transporter permease [Lacticaseibacillus zhaodongensis]